MDHSQSSSTRNSTAYQVMLVALLSLNFGIVFFDRNALNFLMPFVQPELSLRHTQVGILASALSLTWALAAFGIGVVSDRTGSRKGLLILATLAFSACSFLSGLAATFVAMLGARLLMGVAEGGIMPISQAMIASGVTPQRRGLAMGVTQNFGSNLLGSFVAPVLLVAFATAFGWRNAFFLAGIPGLVAALLLWKLVREPAAPPAGARRDAAGPTMSWRQAFAERNPEFAEESGEGLPLYVGGFDSNVRCLIRFRRAAVHQAAATPLECLIPSHEAAVRNSRLVGLS